LAMVEELGRRIYYSHKEKLPLLGDVWQFISQLVNPCVQVQLKSFDQIYIVFVQSYLKRVCKKALLIVLTCFCVFIFKKSLQKAHWTLIEFWALGYLSVIHFLVCTKWVIRKGKNYKSVTAKQDIIV
jgi:hypothetical protein